MAKPVRKTGKKKEKKEYYRRGCPYPVDFQQHDCHHHGFERQCDCLGVCRECRGSRDRERARPLPRRWRRKMR